MRLETDQQGLHVIQNYFVKNDSSPPRTQLSTHSYEIYLPEGAQVEASAAMAPGGMPVSSSPVPLGDKGHYAFVFPIRPGETRFQVSYRLPYSGSFKFSERLATSAENVAIIMPKSMKFTPSASTPFSRSTTTPTRRLSWPRMFRPRRRWSSRSRVRARCRARPRVEKPVRRRVGRLRRMPPSDQPASPEAGSAAAASDTRPGGGLGNPIDTPDPLTKYRWWILGSLSLILAAAAAFFLRTPTASAAAALAGAPASTPFAAAAAGTFANAGSLAPADRSIRVRRRLPPRCWLR